MTRGEAKARRARQQRLDDALAMVRFTVASALDNGADPDDVLHEVHDGMRDAGRLKSAETFRRAMELASRPRATAPNKARTRLRKVSQAGKGGR